MSTTYWLSLGALFVLSVVFEICYRKIMQEKKEPLKATPNEEEILTNESI